MNATSKRTRKLIQLIHIAATKCRVCVACGELGFAEKCAKCGHSAFFKLEKNAYRALLNGMVMCESTSDMTVAELQHVLTYFQSKGFVIERRQQFNMNDELMQERRRVIESIEERAPVILGTAWQSRINGFLQKRGRDSLQFCSMKDLRAVQGFLSTVDRKNKERPA